MKVVAPPIEGELSFSIGTFLNNYDVINRKTIRKLPRRTYSTIQKEMKRLENNIVENTQAQLLLLHLVNITHIFHFSYRHLFLCMYVCIDRVRLNQVVSCVLISA